MFTCTGSEANDLALRIARHYTGGTGVIVTANAYHGVTAAVAEVSPSLRPNVPLGPHVRVVPAHRDLTSPARRRGDRDLGATASGWRRSSPTRCSPPTASSPTPPGSCARARQMHEAGGLYIADEVQAGFARTGLHMWGYQRHGLTPDIVTMGKPMGNGLPIAGLVARQDILEDFGRKVRYFNTFGGNPVCVAAASAVLDVLEAEGLPANAAATGAYLKDAIARLAAGSLVLGDVRGVGLYLGVDVVSPETGEPSGEVAAAIVNRMRERRVLISATGPQGSVLKIRPPLPFGPEHADQFLTGDCCRRCRRRRDGAARRCGGGRGARQRQANWDMPAGVAVGVRRAAREAAGRRPGGPAAVRRDEPFGCRIGIPARARRRGRRAGRRRRRTRSGRRRRSRPG